ncbi:uncharacterized protein A1O9_02711 [Exophiala aquamarina CBS 119918]|uniref:Uncharacterized protein n=1 Tax=Exophiala aquamarina CBS 119918 TaxID=1182545 RepID=A0A072PMN9_9EURO|nr:uncharacterized protein A1O9_02711 [Exophiala aquamarina CBS 119918]KEF61146.1 hypothetical protein A1O9_02711 [Exophiala aquamarina CBS 119918]
MGSLKYDSELMTLQVPAVAVPGSRSFATIRDERAQPLLISHSTNGKLLAIKEDDTGNRHTIDLTQAFGAGVARLVDFDVSQDADDGMMYMSFATASQDGNSIDLHVIKPFHPRAIVAGGKNSLSHLRIPRTGAPIPKTLTRVFMGPMAPTIMFPDVVLAFKEDIRDSQDVARVAIEEDYSGWTLETDFELPENAAEIHDICPAVLPIGNGYFCLYSIQGETKLLFKTITLFNGFPYQALLTCPQGARCLATYPDRSGFSSLVVGGDEGLQHFKPAEGQRRNHPGKKISVEGEFKDVRQLHIAHSPAKISFFATTSMDSVSYATTMDRSFTSPLGAVLLLPEGAGGSFSPFVQQEGLTQQIIVANISGDLKVIQQDSVSGIWSGKPYYIPDLNENIDYDGYMTDMIFTAENGKPLIEQVVMLKASGHSEIIVNGRHVLVGPQGTKVLTDDMGKLALLTPTDDIATDIFTVTNAGDDHPDILPPGMEIEIDPADKVHAKLDLIQSGDDLRNAKLPNGEGILDGTDASDEDIDNVATVIRDINKERNNMKNRSKQGIAAKRFTSPDAPRRVVGGRNVESLMARRRNAITLGWEYVEGFLKGAWDKLKSWAVEFAEGVVELYLEVKDSLVRFVIDTVEKIRKGLAAFFEMVIGGLKKFVEWLKAVFNVGNILKTQRSLMGLVNGMLDAGPLLVNQWRPFVEKAFDDTAEIMKNFTYPKDALEAKAGYEAKKANQAPEMDAEETSAQKNYANYQMKHGGAAANAVAGGEGGSHSTLEAIWNDLIEPVLESFGDIFVTMGENILLLFNDQDNLSAGEVFQKLGADVILGIIDALKKLFLGLMDVGSAFISDMKKLINEEIRIPFFSAFYKTITGGQTLTALSAAMLVIAFPTNIAMVTFTGEPLDIGEIDFLSYMSPTPSRSIRGLLPVTTTKGKDDHATATKVSEDETPVELEFAFGVTEFITRGVLLIVDMVAAKAKTKNSGQKPEPVGDSVGAIKLQEEPEYRTVSLNNSDSQLYKFYSPPTELEDSSAIHAVNPKAVQPRGVPLKAMGTGFLFALRGLSLVITYPFWDPNAKKDPFPEMRGLSWIMPVTSVVCGWIIDLADRRAWKIGMDPDKYKIGKDIVLAIVNWVFALIPACADIAGGEVDTAMAIVRVMVTVLDLVSALGAAAFEKSSSFYAGVAWFGGEAVSDALLLATVIRCRKLKAHNWMVCSSK